MSDSQSQRSGDASINIQGRDISVGLSFTEARQVALDVFNANFVRLADVARDIANRRAEELIDMFVESVARKGRDHLRIAAEMRSPDMQFALFMAQQTHARIGDPDLRDLLVSLLVDRATTTERTLLQIVLNESLTVASKLTTPQLDALTIVFLTRESIRSGLNTPDGLVEYLRSSVEPFVTLPEMHDSAYEHLTYTGCATTGDSMTFEEIMRSQYATLFIGSAPVEAFEAALPFPLRMPNTLLIDSFHRRDGKQLAVREPAGIRGHAGFGDLASENINRLIEIERRTVLSGSEIRDYLVRERPNFERLFAIWDNSAIRSLRLTSVGITIAQANLERRTGERLDLAVWI